MPLRLLPLLLVAAGFLAGTAPASAQEQEQGMLARIESARPDSTRVNPMQNQAFSVPAYGTKKFAANSYGDIKAAPSREFVTRSFFGLKNPWFGRKVFAAGESALENKTDRAAGSAYRTGQFQTNESQAPRAFATGNTTAAGTQPRPYLVPGKTQKGLDQFTQNLQKDLTIDDVRDLLNKGKSN